MLFNPHVGLRAAVWRRLRLLSLGLACGGLLAACAAPVPPERRPINERPMFGAVEKTESHMQADRKLVEDTLAFGITVEEGAERMIARGWQFMEEGEPGMAMRRFNQAWLLDPDNGSSYWGMAAAVWDRDAIWGRDAAFAQAEDLFLRAEAFLPDNADLQVDFGRLYGHAKMPEQAAAHYRRALDLNPEVHDGLRNMAVAQLDLRDIEAACRYAAESAERGNPLGNWFFAEIRARGQSC